jgi:quercetin dioxygenase-like cupin family protein
METPLQEVVYVDIRSIEGVPASPEHQGTVPVWWLYRPRELKGATAGGYLELVSEFEVKGGGSVHPHRHHTHEFYYVVSGRGHMTIEGETREIIQGDLVHIPPDALHSLAPVSPNASIRCFCFAVGLRDTAGVDYSAE